MNFGRRIRAVLVTAAVWGAAWSIPGFVWIARLNMHRSDGLPFHLPSVLRDVFMNWSVLGSIAGTIFALILGLAERRSSLDALSMRRVAGWGAIGGAAFPLIVLPLVSSVAPEFARQFPAIHDLSAALRQALLIGTTFGVLGAVCAGVSLRLARRADRDQLAVSEAAPLVAAGPPTNPEADQGVIDDARAVRTRI